jgi:hypothetical protein
MRTNLIFTIIFLLGFSVAISQNLIDSDDWIAGTSGSTTNYSTQGTTAQNSRITMTGPFSNQVTVWKATADGASGMNGGFVHKGFIMQTNKTYRVSFWMRSSANSCSNFSGFVSYYTTGGLVQPFEREDGTNASWPYFSTPNLQDDKWFLVVGYIRPNTESDVGDSGIYDPSQGSATNIVPPTYTATDYIFPNGVSAINTRIRTFMWACSSGEMYVYDPRIEELPNATPLSTLLYGDSVNVDNPPSAPTNLVSTSKTETTVSLNWTASTDDNGVTGYKVFTGSNLTATLNSVSNYEVTGLSAGTSYQFSVKALDAAGNESIDSNTIAVTTNTSSGSGGSSGDDTWIKSGSNVSLESNSDNFALGRSTVPSGYKLAVEGHVRAREIRVDQDAWPDYVFKSNYSLPTLEEVEKCINEKGHLPNIPSAKEVGENGIELGEMNKLLLEKIEELTLYVIKLEKNFSLQQEEIKRLKKTFQKN